MINLEEKTHLSLLEAWKLGSKTQRQQMIAIEIFGLNVDPNFGKIVEKKDTGGVRLLNMPEWTEPEKAKKKVEEIMKEHGWRIETIPAPRSSRVTALATCERLGGAEVDSPLMPEADAVCFVALAAMRLEKEIANKECDNA